MKDCLALLDESIKLSTRIQKLRQHHFNTVPPLCVERARFYTQSFRSTQNQPMTIRRAMALDHILSHISLYMTDGELLLGGLAEKPRGSSIFPEFSVQWIMDELQGIPCSFDQRTNDPYIVDPAVKRELLEDILPYWQGKTQQDRVNSQLPQETWNAGMEVKGFDGSWIMMSGDGHTIPDFKKILEQGITGILDETEAKLASLDLSNPDDLRQLPFLQSVLIVHKAVIKYAARLSEFAIKSAEQTVDPVRRSELLKLGNICARVPSNPAYTFHEGLQSILIMHIAIQMESNGHGISLGRLDQYLYPLYQHDIANGVLSSAEALELLEAFYIKLNGMSKLRNVDDTKYFVGYMIYPNLTIGGQTEMGKDAVNELSYLCLAATKKLKMIQPLLAARFFTGSSEVFRMECARAISLGIGMPALYNDDAIIPALLNLGYQLDDALDYGITGCVEPSPQGKIGGRFGAAFPNPVKVLEVTMNGGADPRTGLTLLKGKAFTEMTSYDELESEFNRQQVFYLHHHVLQDNLIDLVWEELLPTPLLSSMIENCIQRGKGIKEGGAKYDFTGGQMVGTASCINCLATIKKLVFDEKFLTVSQLDHALKSNFTDTTTAPSGEEIRQILLNRGAKFGNDDPLVDNIASKFIRFWATSKTSYKNTRYGRGPIGGFFIPSTATVAANVPAGSIIGATADGRRAGEPISEGISAYGGSDINGPTALVNSISAIPNILYAGGQLLNVKFNPNSLQNEAGLRNLISLVKTLFAKKGFQIQINAVDKETLLEAQKHPENYQDLMVRVAGYSAYFVTLNTELQEDIIRRTEHIL